MRLADKSSRRLVDVEVLQADRLQDRSYKSALARGAFDPFPDGTHTAGPDHNSGALAKNSGITEFGLSGGALSGFDGALPEHIQEALQRGLHENDESLKDFLAIFDRRLMQLDIRARKASVLVATQDDGAKEDANVIDRLMRMVTKVKDDQRYLKLLFPLLSRIRSLDGLRDVVSWLTDRDVKVSVNFDTVHSIDASSRTTLSAKPSGNAGLGHGTLLGRFGRAPLGRIAISIACTDRQDLDRLASSSDWSNELKQVITHFLRDPVPVTIYADVMRHMLNAPRLSAKKQIGDRLGAYNLLNPERAPNQRASIKLTEISI
ncbi:type VI secretion system baseplate subunit TssG [Planktotalea sp.]|uniref:type VI secretion system baseplate subunit TssG n=1 Tax=Planktotalea sp. TaxID=2029877 RepID=UPI0025E74314|nr:type VI secretion system baseplate subunit TssG [Planktotalea sp.]